MKDFIKHIMRAEDLKTLNSFLKAIKESDVDNPDDEILILIIEERIKQFVKK